MNLVLPKISIIIPVYNVEPYLRRCLDSVVNQTLSDIEVICINDASTDSSLEILNEYAKKDSRIKIVDFEENKNAANARNAGFKIANGEYLGFVDSDDYIDLDFYEKLYGIAKTKDADIVKGVLKIIQLNGHVIINNSNETIRKNNTRMAFTYDWCTAIYRASLVHDNNIRFPAECPKAEDCVFLNRCMIKSKKFIFIDDTCYYYCKRNGSLNSKKLSPEYIKSTLTAVRLILEGLNSAPSNEVDEKDYVYAYSCYLNTILFHISFQNDTLECKRMCAQNFMENYHKCKNKIAVDKVIFGKDHHGDMFLHIKNTNIEKIVDKLCKYPTAMSLLASNLRKKVVTGLEHEKIS